MILDKYNYEKYVNIPDYVIEKLNDNKLKLAHFSDILRMALLSKYGGIWVDSTLYFNKNIFEKFIQKDFNTTKDNIPYISVAEGKWSIFLIGGSSNNLFKFVYEFLLEYVKKYDFFIDYLLTDYIISVAYDNFEYVRNLINNSAFVNEKIYELQKCFSKEYSKEEYSNLMKNDFFKLNYKKKIAIRTKNGSLTNFGYFIAKLDEQ